MAASLFKGISMRSQVNVSQSKVADASDELKMHADNLVQDDNDLLALEGRRALEMRGMQRPRTSSMFYSVRRKWRFLYGDAGYDNARAVRVSRWQREMRSFLDDPNSGIGARAFSIGTVFLIVTSTCILVFSKESRCHISLGSRNYLNILEMTACIFFTFELVARYAVAKNTFSFIFSGDWYILFDALAVVPCWSFWTIFCFIPKTQILSCGSIATFLSALRMFRILKLGRKYEGGIVILRALKLSTPALTVAFFFLVVSVIVFSTFLFFLEKVNYTSSSASSKSNIHSIPHAIWFVLVTMSTVGFGDVVPITVAGRCLTSVAMVFGVLFLAMPLAIVGNNFCMVWEDKERVIFADKIRTLLAMKNLTSEDLLQTLQTMDRDHSGMLSFREFKDALKIMQIQMPPKRLSVLWRTLDTNRSGDVALRDFMALIHEDEPDVLTTLINTYMEDPASLTVTGLRTAVSSNTSQSAPITKSTLATLPSNSQHFQADDNHHRPSTKEETHSSQNAQTGVRQRRRSSNDSRRRSSGTLSTLSQINRASVSDQLMDAIDRQRRRSSGTMSVSASHQNYADDVNALVSILDSIATLRKSQAKLRSSQASFRSALDTLCVQDNKHSKQLAKNTA